MQRAGCVIEPFRISLQVGQVSTTSRCMYECKSNACSLVLSRCGDALPWVAFVGMHSSMQSEVPQLRLQHAVVCCNVTGQNPHN